MRYVVIRCCFWVMCLVLSPAFAQDLGHTLEPTRGSCQFESESSSPSFKDRLALATHLYHLVVTRFVGPMGAGSQAAFEQTYTNYLGTLTCANRRTLYLESMALIASLRSGHSWVRDALVEREEGEPTGLRVFYQRPSWIVVASQQPGVTPGDVIVTVDGAPIEEYFAARERFIAASSQRAAQAELFSYGILFPKEFTVGLASGKRVVVHRSPRPTSQEMEPAASGRWLIQERVAYIRIPAMLSARAQVESLDLLNHYRRAATLIVDVRGVRGGELDGEPRAMQAKLIGHPYRMWMRTTRGQLADTDSDNEHVEISGYQLTRRPEGDVYSGQVILLVDRECMSVCESFVLPFKTEHRALLIGESTAGTFALTFHREVAPDVEINLATTLELFPDGKPFEGVGIEPDIEVALSPEDLRAGRDSILQAALRNIRADGAARIQRD